MNGKSVLDELEASLNEDGVSPFEILPSGEIRRKSVEQLSHEKFIQLLDEQDLIERGIRAIEAGMQLAKECLTRENK